MVLAAYPQSVAERVISVKNLENSVLTLSKGNSLSHQFIKETLSEYGFTRVDLFRNQENMHCAGDY